MAIPLPADASLPMLYINAGGKGYFRTAYTPDQYAAIKYAADTGDTPHERKRLRGGKFGRIRRAQADAQF